VKGGGVLGRLVWVGPINRLWRVKLWSWVELGSKEILGMMGPDGFAGRDAGKGEGWTTVCD
jgi:hypothetical protein